MLAVIGARSLPDSASCCITAISAASPTGRDRAAVAISMTPSRGSKWWASSTSSSTGRRSAKAYRARMAIASRCSLRILSRMPMKCLTSARATQAYASLSDSARSGWKR